MKAILERCLEANDDLQVESLGELARLLNKPLRTLDNWVNRGLPRQKVAPRRFAYNLKEVATWILESIEGESPELDESDPTFKWRLKFAASHNEAERYKEAFYSVYNTLKDITGLPNYDGTTNVPNLLLYIEEIMSRCAKESAFDLNVAYCRANGIEKDFKKIKIL